MKKLLEEGERLEVGRESMRFMSRVAAGMETGKVYEDMVMDGATKAALTRKKDHKVEVPLILKEKERDVDEEWIGWRRGVPRLWSGIWASLGYVGGGVGLEGQVVKKIDLSERLEIGGDEIRWLQDVVKEGVIFGKVKTHPEFWKEVVSNLSIYVPGIIANQICSHRDMKSLHHYWNLSLPHPSTNVPSRSRNPSPFNPSSTPSNKTSKPPSSNPKPSPASPTSHLSEPHAPPLQPTPSPPLSA